MSQEEKNLIKILGLFTLSTSTASVFLGLFLFRLGGFKIVAEFNVIYLIFLLVGYIFSGWSLKKISSSQGIQIGLFLYSLSYFLLVIFGRSAIDYLFLLGIIFGLSSGTFWSSNNLSQYILTNEDSRSEYFSKLNSLTSIGSMLGPLIGGGVISFFVGYHLPYIGYLSVFGLVGTLMLYVALLAKRLPFHSQIKFNPKDFLSNATKRWYLVLTQQFILGLYDAAFATLSAIIIFLIVKNEFKVGVINAICAFTYAAVSFFMAKILRKYNKSYIPGMIGVSIGLFLFGYFHNILSILILIGMVYGLTAFISTPTSKAIYDVLDEIPGNWQEKYHFLIERDVFLGSARVITYAILLFFLTSQNSLNTITIWIMCIAIIPTLTAGIQYKLDRPK